VCSPSRCRGADPRHEVRHRSPGRRCRRAGRDSAGARRASRPPGNRTRKPAHNGHGLPASRPGGATWSENHVCYNIGLGVPSLNRAGTFFGESDKVNTTQKHRTTVTPGRASTRWYAATLCAACLSVACVGLLASCAAAPEGASPAQVEQPADAEPQVAQLPAAPASEADRSTVPPPAQSSRDDQASRKRAAARKPAAAARAARPSVAKSEPLDAAPPVKAPTAASPQEPAAAPQAKPARTVQTTAAQAGQQRRPALSPRVSPATRPATTQPASSTDSGCGSKSKRAIPTPSPDGPQPRWVCESEITADPVWYGQPLDFVFEIRNEGEGDLQIQLKGG